MSGHSKWSTIKRQKGVTDTRRGALFTKLSKDITLATKQGNSGDPDLNFRLRLALLKAREANMPQDNIQRAIRKGLGEDDGAELQELTYEGYGPAGIAILVETMTDNRNRTAAEVRAALSRYGGNLGDVGSVGWLFSSRGVITIAPAAGDPDAVALVAIDLGAEDVRVDADGSIEIITMPDDLEKVRDGLETAKIALDNTEIAMVPTTTIPLTTPDAESVLRLLDRLEELDDVQRVYSNGDFPEEVLAAAGA